MRLPWFCSVIQRVDCMQEMGQAPAQGRGIGGAF